MKKQAPGQPEKAKDVEVGYYTVTGLIFLVGMILFVFMVVLCFNAKKSGATQMLILLDAVQVVMVVYLLLTYRHIKKIVEKRLGFSRGAVERPGDGSARLEYSVASVPSCMDLAKEEKVGSAGMTNVWYDPDDPRNIFLCNEKPKKASPFALANVGLLLVLSGIVNAVFFLFLA